MNCQDARAFIPVYADGELEPSRHLEIESHIADCAVCRQAYRQQRALSGALRSEELYFHAPPDLADGIRAALPRKARRLPAAVAAMAAVAACVVVAVLYTGRGDGAEPEIVASHIRSLMPGHLTDVASSDQHNVKPWFNGRVDFSPTVPDLSAQGFTLVGGRLDYVSDRPVAALVYRRRQHVINVYIWPAPGASEQPAASSARQGYHLFRWRASGMQYRVISDLNERELGDFARLFYAATK